MPRESKGSRKRKFQGNQHVADRGKRSQPNGASASRKDNSERRLSASSKKFGNHKPAAKEKKCNGKKLRKGSNITGYRFFDMDILAEVFAEMPCRECYDNKLICSEVILKRRGCASFLRLFCKSCGWKNEFYTSRKVNYFFEVNRRFVYALRSIGQGHASAKRLCGVMNMPPPPQPNAYDRHNKAWSKVSKCCAAETMIQAGKEIRNLKSKNGDEIAKCGVSCDGTWHRRGHSSLNGCVTAISMDTGKCLDMAVLCKNCPSCKRQGGKENTEQYRLWKAEHAGKCKANYHGSSPAMETAGVKQIFQRSVQKNSLLYTEYFGDGDSKGYNEVKNTYLEIGEEVVKKECVGHVQKRVGTALRKLKKENKGMGGKGKLTNNMVDKLQNYYGIAIRSNVGDLKGMKKSIHASLMHCASSKDRDLHQHCPDGTDSWCKFKKDQVIKPAEPTYKPGPGLPLEVIAELKPVYVRLSDDELLKRCLDGKTQNQNESLNGMIWDRLPKGVFVGKDTLDLGVNDAVAHFNIGCQATINMLEKQGMEPGRYCCDAMVKADCIRITKGDYKAEDKNKIKRKKLRAKSKKKDDTMQEIEGVTYAAGEF